MIATGFSLPWAVRAAPQRFVWARNAVVMVQGMLPSHSPQLQPLAPAPAPPPTLPAPPPIVVEEIPHEIVVAEDDAASAPQQETEQATQPATTDRARRPPRAKPAMHARRPRSLLPPDEDATMPLDDAIDGGAR